MIQMKTILDVADNSKAKKLSCIKTLKGKSAKAGEIILVSVKRVKTGKHLEKDSMKKGDVCKAIVLLTKKGFSRPDGSKFCFSRNNAILLDKKGKPLGTRIAGPVYKELRKHRTLKILSMATSVI